MKPVPFAGQNSTFAKNQPEYNELPAHKSDSGIVTSCYELSDVEIARLAQTKRIWLQVWSFNQPLQPQRLSIATPDLS